MYGLGLGTNSFSGSANNVPRIIDQKSRILSLRRPTKYNTTQTASMNMVDPSLVRILKIQPMYVLAKPPLMEMNMGMSQFVMVVGKTSTRG